MKKDKNQQTLVVVGGGAAGIFCAIHAAKNHGHLKVIVLEKSNKLLSKVKISGGGRCNVTHACFRMSEMVQKYPRGKQFLKKSFRQFFTTDTIKWFEDREVKLKAEEDGRMFPKSNSSQTIIDCLLKEAENHHVDIAMQSDVISIQKSADIFHLKLKNNRQLQANYVCIATGGFPKLTMFDWLKDLGHTIESPVPSLFTFNFPKHPITKLMGISVDSVEVKIKKSKLKETGPILITHWGLSGPVVLKLSAWGARELFEKQWKFSILINWVPEYNEESMRNKILTLRQERANQKVINKNHFGIAQRLWEFIISESGIPLDMRWTDIPAKEQNKLIKNICAYEMDATGKTTFKEEFVTAGGINLTEVDPETMMSRKIKNLYFAGEILNVDGITGGYNFQHAWTSGFIAGKLK